MDYHEYKGSACSNKMLIVIPLIQAKYSYTQLVVSVKAGEDDLGDFIRALNPAGDKGWENYSNVHVGDDIIMFFKRRI